MEQVKLRQVTTQTISIHTNYNKAFDYLANPLNQKEWAINFIQDIKQTAHGFLAITPLGETPVQFITNKQAGIIDMQLGNADPINTRLIKNQHGCEYVFTLFQPQGMPDHVWQNEGIPSLQEELKVLKSILENK